jgi:copper homeostasis protein
MTPRGAVAVPKPKVLIEVVVDSVESAAAAESGGAGRLELCADLVEGGTTPSAGMIAECRDRVRIPLYVMIRPRGGDFLYSDAEFDVMRRDIRQARALGADGIVLGLLLPDGRIDAARTARLIRQARPLDVTFHRAIDVCRDPFEALDALAAMGVDRVLTSGQADSASGGLKTIARMVRHAANRMVILAGGRINEKNARRIVERTGVREIHVRGARQVRSGMKHRSAALGFRGKPLASDYVNEYTDTGRIRALVKSLS